MYRSLASVALLLCAASALADPLSPVSYDMRNGVGQLNGGQFNYWDKEYTGSGATGTDDTLLTGGLGNLTDGVVATQNWISVENVEGTGPYVGWRSSVRPLVEIAFNFAGPVSVDTIRIHADDSAGNGGVNLPGSATFVWNGGSVTRTITDPSAGTEPSWLDFANLGITNAASVTVQLSFVNEWVFVDEVQFAGVVPEPARVALMLGGLVLIGAAVRRQRG